MPNTEPKTITAKITQDAQKLWSCENFLRITGIKHLGKLPIHAGEEIELLISSEMPSPFCSAKRAWAVAKAPKGISLKGNFRVCEHQVDLPEEGREATPLAQGAER